MPANRLAMLQLISALQNPNVDYDEIERLISKDVALSYRLLNIINSAYYARTQKIDSIRQCLLLLGMKAIKTTVSLLLLSNIDDKPHELLTTAMIRAKMSEQIAIEMGYREAQKFFLVGLFSVLDVLLDRSMRELLQDLPLQEDISKALLGQGGILGTIISCVLAYERGKWNEIKALGLDDVLVIEAYLNAISWANDMNAIL